MNGSGVHNAEYRGFADGPFRQAQVDVTVQVSRCMAAYPAVGAAGSRSQRHPQVLTVTRAAVSAVIGVNEFGASRSRNAGNVGIGCVTDIIRGIGSGSGYGGGGGADFSDIFGDVFGDIFGGGRRQRASRGSDLRYNMDLTL